MSELPDTLRDLLTRLVDSFRKTLGDNLVGVYVHGSLAMGGFNPVTSDIDFLVVVHEPLTIDTKRAILDFALDLAQDAPQKGLEFSVVLLRHTQNFVFPTPYELHLSPMWYESVRSHTMDLVSPSTDPDLAAHFMITQKFGQRLYGWPIQAVFGEVPEEAYWAALAYDLEGIWHDIGENPVYGVLNLCRITAYKRDKRILSKLDGGLWGLAHFDAAYHPLIQQALDEYQADASGAVVWDYDVLTRLANEARKLCL